MGGSDTGVARDAIVEAVFGAWLTKRHASADRHSFAHAAAVLAVVVGNAAPLDAQAYVSGSN